MVRDCSIFNHIRDESGVPILLCIVQFRQKKKTCFLVRGRLLLKTKKSLLFNDLGGK